MDGLGTGMALQRIDVAPDPTFTYCISYPDPHQKMYHSLQVHPVASHQIIMYSYS